jgi:hypothetical protein
MDVLQLWTKEIIQTSCSELLVDTRVSDPQKAYARFSKLFEKVGWFTTPELTLETLTQLKEKKLERIVIEDPMNKGQAHLLYSDDDDVTVGYIIEGDWDYDEKAYPIFKTATEKMGGTLKTYDGGHAEGYEDWKDANNNGES